MPGQNQPLTLISVTGAPGAGKTFTAINLALAFSLLGQNTLFLDMNPYPDNCGKVLDLVPEITLLDWLESPGSLKNVVRRGFGIDVVFYEENDHSETEIKRHNLTRALNLLENYDVVVVDYNFRQGIKPENSLTAISPCNIMVAVPEPTSITAVYMQIKTMLAAHVNSRVELLLNRVGDEPQAMASINSFEEITLKFLGRKYELLDTIPETVIPFNPVFGAKPLMVSDVNNPAAKKLLATAKKLQFYRDTTIRLSENIIAKMFYPSLNVPTE